MLALGELRLLLLAETGRRVQRMLLGLGQEGCGKSLSAGWSSCSVSLPCFILRNK